MIGCGSIIFKINTLRDSLHCSKCNCHKVVTVDEGKFCVPKQKLECNPSFGKYIYTPTGWECVPLYKDIYETDGTGICWIYDYKYNNTPTAKVSIYEKLEDGLPRYRCSGCLRFPQYPHMCLKDYCGSGYFENGKCICGPMTYNTNESSPCSENVWRVISDNVIKGEDVSIFYKITNKGDG